MSNIELARYLMTAMYILAEAIIYSFRGNRDKAIESDKKYKELFDALDKMEVDA